MPAAERAFPFLRHGRPSTGTSRRASTPAPRIAYHARNP
jgi:hypothetical protein